MPQLGQSQDAPPGAHQAKGVDPTAPLGLAAAPRLPARPTNRFVSPISHGQVLVTKPQHHATAAAVGTAKQPPEEEQAPEVQRDGTGSAGQAPDKGQAKKKKKDRKEKKRKHKGSKQSLAVEESSAHRTSSSLAGPSDQGRSSSLEPSSAAAAAAGDNRAMVKRNMNCCPTPQPTLSSSPLLPPRTPNLDVTAPDHALVAWCPKHMHVDGTNSTASTGCTM